METSTLEGDEMLSACLNHLQELSQSLDEKKTTSGKMKPVISVIPSHHPFYDSKAEVSGADTGYAFMYPWFAVERVLVDRS